MPAQKVKDDEPDIGVGDVAVAKRPSGDWWPLDDPDEPVQSWFRWDGKSERYEIFYQQDVTDLIELNKAAANHNDGYSPTRGIRRAASIPQGIRQKWLVEEGWDAFDRENWSKLKRKLNSSEWAYLRNAPGRL